LRAAAANDRRLESPVSPYLDAGEAGIAAELPP
jgi:hypothetical protein